MRLVTFLAALVLLALAPRLNAEDASPLLGVWECKEEALTLELREGGKGTLDGTEVGWRVDGERLVITEEGDEVTYAFKLVGAALTMSGGDLDRPMTFQRKDAPKRGLGGHRGGLVGKATGEAADAPPPVKKPETGGIAGEWTAHGANGEVVLLLGSDGAGKIGSNEFQYKTTEKTLTLSNAGQSVDYAYELHGDVLVLSGGDLAAATEFHRKGAVPAGEAAPPAKGGIEGTWQSTNETIEIRADGTIAIGGQTVRYTVNGQDLTLEGPKGKATLQFELSGDTLTISANGSKESYRRAGTAAAGGAQPEGVAGVWMVQESSLDPSNYMSFTQYVTLFPDGTVAWEKAESGATRDAVNERFRSWRNGASGPGGDNGRWESDGRTITVQWRLWNGLVSKGEVDLAGGKMTLSGMGTLEEGATLTFERQQ